MSFLILAALVASLTVFASAAPEQLIGVRGLCWSNETHWGDDRGVYGPLYYRENCWRYILSDNCRSGYATFGSPCTAGPDVHHSRDQKIQMIKDRCYPSRRGELLDPKCCGGYKICQADPEFSADHFNSFVDSMFSFNP